MIDYSKLMQILFKTIFLFVYFGKQIERTKTLGELQLCRVNMLNDEAN